MSSTLTSVCAVVSFPDQALGCRDLPSAVKQFWQVFSCVLFTYSKIV